MMEVFERHHVSFVSVTQHFNTATPMGRLILNILLSFAQFEREIISERTRDKIAATRARASGPAACPSSAMTWSARPDRPSWWINEDEAVRVRAIFELYLDRQSLIETVKELDVRGWTTKRWSTRKDRERGGLPFNKNRLFRLLTNVLYLARSPIRMRSTRANTRPSSMRISSIGPTAAETQRRDRWQACPQPVRRPAQGPLALHALRLRHGPFAYHQKRQQTLPLLHLPERPEPRLAELPVAVGAGTGDRAVRRRSGQVHRPGHELADRNTRAVPASARGIDPWPGIGEARPGTRTSAVDASCGSSPPRLARMACRNRWPMSRTVIRFFGSGRPKCAIDHQTGANLLMRQEVAGPSSLRAGWDTLAPREQARILHC